MSIFKNKKGFTLIEFLIYLGIFSVVLTIISGMSIALSRNASEIASRNSVDQNLESAFSLLVDRAHKAQSISSPVSGSANSVTFEGTDAAMYPATFSINNGVLQVSDPSGSNIPLMDTSVHVTNFTVTKIVDPLSGVQVQLTIEPLDTGYFEASEAKTLQTSVIFSYGG